MPLIDSDRLLAGDMDAWVALSRLDRLKARMSDFRRHVAQAEREIRTFTVGPCYVGVSWGKDSVCLAHLVHTIRPDLPLCWVRTPRWEMPETFLVRDAFLSRFAPTYREYEDHELPLRMGSNSEVYAVVNDREVWPPARDFGPRYLSGVRAEESGTRKRRVMGGLSTENTCAPLGWWTADDVFAYLALHDLPIHPAYAMSHGGLMDRGRLRVSPVGDERGVNMGRRDWEKTYYLDLVTEIHQLAHGRVAPCDHAPG